MESYQRNIPNMARRLKWGNTYFHPQFFGLETLDMRRPALFVGNHTLYGILDVPFMISALYEKHHVLVRSLGDKAHFLVPLWKDLLAAHGMVIGTPETCAALMQAGQSILVFPGGAREVMRRRDEKYQLIWKKRTGFARMAIEHGYDIIPFASLGPDDCFDIIYDANDFQKSTLLKPALDKFHFTWFFRNGDVIPPLIRGLGPTLIPRPQRFYFSFGQRITTTDWQTDQTSLWQLREQVASSIEGQLTQLMQYRATDKPHWPRWRQWLTQ